MLKPSIDDIKRGDELKKWYWTKLELQAKAKQLGTSATGAKFDILDRIAEVLDGEASKKSAPPKPKSRFDWGKETINDDTIITDSYRNSQKVRAYMQSKVQTFKFTIDFMEWMRENTGKTMGQAAEYYAELSQKMKDGTYIPEIKRHNQYNKYLRDFSEANPSLSLEDAKRCWKYKTSLPSQDGMHAYEVSDLSILN